MVKVQTLLCSFEQHDHQGWYRFRKAAKQLDTPVPPTMVATGRFQEHHCSARFVGMCSWRRRWVPGNKSWRSRRPTVSDGTAQNSFAASACFTVHSTMHSFSKMCWRRAPHLATSRERRKWGLSWNQWGGYRWRKLLLTCVLYVRVCVHAVGTGLRYHHRCSRGAPPSKRRPPGLISSSPVRAYTPLPPHVFAVSILPHTDCGVMSYQMCTSQGKTALYLYQTSEQAITVSARSAPAVYPRSHFGYELLRARSWETQPENSKKLHFFGHFERWRAEGVFLGARRRRGSAPKAAWKEN